MAYPGLATCGGIFRGSMRDLLEFFLRFLKFRLLWLLRFMGLYMLWRKLKRWGLLMSDWNVILLWFVLRLLLGKMFLECFVINGILVLITVRKLGLGLLIFFWMLRNRWNTCLNYCEKIRFRVTHIFCEGNVCADKLANLGFIHKESLH